MGPRLRVGVDAQLARIDPRTGHGNVWRHLVDGLRARVDVVEIGARSRRSMLSRTTARGTPPPDVWLVDGHATGPQPSGAASVAIAYDVRWSDPLQLPSVPVSFLARVAPATETVVRGSTITAVPSEFAAAGFRDLYGLDRNRIRVVPLGVDLPLFAAARDRQAHATSTQPATLPSDDPYVLFVGSVEPRKNIAVLREAMRVVAASGIRLRLVVRLSPAPGMDSRALLAAASAPLATGVAGLDDVIVLPSMSPDGLADVIAGAAAVCLPSSYEGFGLPVIEAMAAGVPVVVAARGSLPEIVGDGGVVVEPDAQAIGRALTRLVTEPELARAIAARGHERAQAFSWEHTVDAVHDLLVEAATIGAADRPSVPPASWLVTECVDRCPVCAEPSNVATPAPPTAMTMVMTTCAACGAHHALQHLARHDDRTAVNATMPPGWPTWLTDTAQFEELQRDRAEQLLDILGHDGATAGRLLDVRCDVGALVTAAAARGWDATGAERVPAVADMARQRAEPLGARIVGDLDDLPDAAGSFDVVVACDWIEREPSPIDALRELRRFVAPGGRVVIATPNWRSAARRWDGERWQHLRALESITFFDPTTLRRAFAGAGMSDVRVRCTTWRSDDLTVAAHTLVPIRRIALSRTHDPTPLTAAALRRLLDVYDRCGVGDTLVAVARIGGATPPIAQPVAPPTAAPTGGPT